ncbi:MAG TPA: type II secretion system F family protein, partial [Nitrospiraceae bacterium]|nr:type II secretion system F family protein [Nitrospiraceae bacterium]
MDMTWVISLLVFMMVLLCSMGVYLVMGSRATMNVIKRRTEGQIGVASSGNESIGVGFKDKLYSLLTSLGKANKPSNESEVSAIREALVTAGYRHAQAPILFMGAKLLSSILVLGFTILLPAKLLGFPTMAAQLVMYVGAASAGYFFPMWWLRYAISQRKEKIQDAFPDALDLMVVCVEAGLGLDAAISRVSSEMRFAHRELAEEFHLVSLELRTGLSRAGALKNLGRRIGLEEVSSLVALLVQTDKFGTSIGQSLRVHSDAMRVNRQLRAEEIAAKLPVKLLFPLVFFIFPSLFVVVIGP